MGIRVPRITVNADFGDDTAFGDLSLLSVGYGLHQAWGNARAIITRWHSPSDILSIVRFA